MSLRFIKHIAKNVLKKMPYCGKIIQEREQMRIPIGHYYSPFPNLEEVKAREHAIFDIIPRTLGGIDLNEDKQLILLETLKQFRSEIPFKDEPQMGLRYYFKATRYGYGDAISLYAMLRHLKPKKVIEIGSGTSSAIMLDVNELFLDSSVEFTFIDPYPEKLYSMVKPTDLKENNVLTKKIQDIQIERFTSLSAGDILFIDSTHISKIGSDVNHIFFEILPSLASGVYVHFHDIFYPFQYTKRLIYLGGVAWNEIYILRAFLQYNSAFEIIFFNNFLRHFHEDKLKELMPLVMEKQINPSNIWLRKC